MILGYRNITFKGYKYRSGASATVTTIFRGFKGVET